MCQVIQADSAASVQARSVDMVYMDPPFFTQREWRGTAGAFSDRWSFDDLAAKRLTSLPDTHASCLRALTAGQPDLLAYLLAMRLMIASARRTLRPTGTLWLHCDDTASAYLRILLDMVFGAARFWGVVTWHRSAGANTTTRGWARVHDSIIVYMRTGAALARLSGPAKSLSGAHLYREVDGVTGPHLSAILNDRIGSASDERLGYPTQKPIRLLSRLIEAATLPGDLVLDPCCGSGTTLVAACNLGRRAIGIDRSADAIATTRLRIQKRPAYQPDLFGVSA